MPTAASGAFSRLAPAVQQWIWKEGWRALRDVQEAAIPIVLQGERDVLVASATASGKTEAAFLPIASRLATEPPEGVGALYVSPLKALINDQHRRLETLFAAVDLPVHRWHGDVNASRKRDVLRGAPGALLITPESLEALFIRRGHELPHLLRGLRYVVVDEFHAFIGSERGRQLQSLLHRVELAVGRSIPRVALSATIGDLDLAGEFLRPGAGDRVHRIVSDRNRQEVRLQVRGYEVAAAGSDAPTEGDADDAGGDAVHVSEDLFRVLRGGRHLAFANRRADVETFADLLRRRCEAHRVPNEFFPHHGSLDRTLREHAEDVLRDAARPATVIATTTLELGIDVGTVESIAQIGPPPSVASMRQRLGRSGRRGEPAVLRVYIREPEIRPDTPPQDQLRTDLVQTIAMVRLLARRWYEPPAETALHLSTLVQQVLSLVAERGEVRADQVWKALCGTGPFRGVDPPLFADLLRDLGGHGLLTQTHTGTLVLGLAGERLVNAYDFYAAFVSPEEYRLVCEARTLGTLPIINPIAAGMALVFGGRRWRVTEVDAAGKTIHLVPAAGGRPPKFGGAAAPVHDRVREEMRAVYEEGTCPAFLDDGAKHLLAEGRASFERLGLACTPLVEWGRHTLVFPWLGDRALHTLALQFLEAGLETSVEGIAILVEGAAPDEVRDCAAALACGGPAPAEELAQGVRNKLSEKHHPLLSEPLLVADYASARLDPARAHRALLVLVPVGRESSPTRGVDSDSDRSCERDARSGRLGA